MPTTQTENARRSRHDALLFEEDEQLLARVVPFLEVGLRAGAPTFVALGPARQQLVLGALGSSRGITVVETERSPHAVELLRGSRRLYRAQSERTQTRVVGDRGARPSPVWDRYEAWIEHVLCDLPVSALCVYDRREVSSEKMGWAHATHRCLSENGGPCASNPAYVEPAHFVAQQAEAQMARLRLRPPVASLRDPTPQAAQGLVQAILNGSPTRREDADVLALATRAVVQNALQYGGLPVNVEVWLDTRITVVVSDQGPGFADPFVGLVDDGDDTDAERGSLSEVYLAVDDIAVWHADGTHVRLSAEVVR